MGSGNVACCVFKGFGLKKGIGDWNNIFLILSKFIFEVMF